MIEVDESVQARCGGIVVTQWIRLGVTSISFAVNNSAAGCFFQSFLFLFNFSEKQQHQSSSKKKNPHTV